MKITKQQFKAALTVAYEAGFDGGRVIQYSPTDTVKRIVKHEVKYAKMRKLNNVRKQEHWNVNKAEQEENDDERRQEEYDWGNDQGEIEDSNTLSDPLAKVTLQDLLADFNFDEEQDNEG